MSGFRLADTPIALTAKLQEGRLCGFRHYLAALLESRRAAPQDDLLTRLVDAEVEGERLSEEEILRFVQLLLAAATPAVSRPRPRAAADPL
jgi:cytochrome P450